MPDALGVIVMIFPRRGSPAGRTSRRRALAIATTTSWRMPGAMPPDSRCRSRASGQRWRRLSLDRRRHQNGNDVVGPMDYSGVLYTSVCNMIHDASGKQSIGLAIVAFDGKGTVKADWRRGADGCQLRWRAQCRRVWVMNPTRRFSPKATETWVTDTVSAWALRISSQAGRRLTARY